MSTAQRLTRVLKEAECLNTDCLARIVLMSDCHRGAGNWGDNFLFNQHLFFAALEYYNQRRFTYIELGDGDELWENRSMKRISQTHSNAFWMMARFYRDERLYMLYGNHDRKKENARFTAENYNKYYCENSNCECELFPGIKVHEGLLLKNRDGSCPILLVHGHQGDLLNDTLWKLARFLVRYVWRGLELAGFHDPTSAARNYRKKERVEKKLANWANREGIMLIAGHTHRPSFPKPGESLYFNDGSCVHPRCITALEIENGYITLVKWAEMTRKDRSLYVGREILEGPVKIQEYFQGL